jgi:hypothetical protein
MPVHVLSRSPRMCWPLHSATSSKTSTTIGNDYLIDLFHEATPLIYQYASLPLSLAGVQEIAPTFKPVGKGTDNDDDKKDDTKVSLPRSESPQLKGKPKQSATTKGSKSTLSSASQTSQLLPGVTSIGSEEQFRSEWELKTCGIFDRGFNWKNIIVAGGAVLACLFPDRNSLLQRHLAQSDIDIFLHSLSHEVSTVFIWRSHIITASILTKLANVSLTGSSEAYQ